MNANGKTHTKTPPTPPPLPFHLFPFLDERGDFWVGFAESVLSGGEDVFVGVVRVASCFEEEASAFEGAFYGCEDKRCLGRKACLVYVCFCFKQQSHTLLAAHSHLVLLREGGARNLHSHFVLQES